VIEKGVNEASVIHRDLGGYYDVELCRISLPHLPITDKVLRELKLKTSELVCHFSRGGKLINSLCAFKLSHLYPTYRDGQQCLRGKIRSCGVGTNLATHLREMHGIGSVTFILHHDMMHATTHHNALEINKIHGFSLDIL
jgi:hypothetical protein